MTYIPTLFTERLVLRPPVLAHFPTYAAFLASSRSRFMGGPCQGLLAWGMFCHDLACWQMFGHGGLMIDLRANGQCIGQVGINHGPEFPEKELGWLLYEGFEKEGYATEAARALREWAFNDLQLTTLVSYVDPGNLSSIAVAQRLGAVQDDTALRQDPEDLVFRHHR